MTDSSQAVIGRDDGRTRDARAADGGLPLWRHEEAAMQWYGWGSPIGLSVAIVSLGIAAVLLRHAILGH